MRRRENKYSYIRLIARCSLNVTALDHKLSPALLHCNMTFSTLSNFMLSLPTEMVLVSDNAKVACHTPAAPATKPAKRSRWCECEGKAYASAPKAPASSARSTTRNPISNDKSSCLLPPKAPQRISPLAVEMLSRAA
jgi:hypothetical protein